MNEISPQPGNPPLWLRSFANDVAGAVEFGTTEIPLGCHFFRDAERSIWEVTLFAGRTEVFGGPADGRAFPLSFSVSVDAVAELFDLRPTIAWISDMSEENSPGPHLSLRGLRFEHQVWLRILQQAPEWAGPAVLVESDTGVMIDCWDA